MADQPKLLSPDEMDAEADSLEKTASAYIARAKQLRAAAAMIRAIQSEPVVSPSSDKGSLLSQAQYGTKRPVQASAIEKPALKPRIRGRDVTSKGPMADAAKRLGMSIKDIAERLGVSYDTARKWSAKGSVPPDIRDRLDKLIPEASPAGRRPRSK